MKFNFLITVKEIGTKSCYTIKNSKDLLDKFEKNRYKDLLQKSEKIGTKSCAKELN